MGQSSFPVPALILQSAAEYMKQKYKMEHVDQALLQHLYQRIQDRRNVLAVFKKKHPEIRVATDFNAARDWVFERQFNQSNPQSAFLHRAYSSGVSKIGNEFALRARQEKKEPMLRLKRSDRDRIMDHVTLDTGGRQYRFIL